MRRALAIAALLLAPAAARAAVSFVSAGAEGTVDTGNVTCGIPGSIQNNDVLFAVVYSSPNTAHSCATNCTGWAEAATQTGGTSDGRLSVWWKRTSGSESAPTFTGPANSFTCRMWAFRGVKTSGNPWNQIGSVVAEAANATFTGDALTPTVADTMMVFVGGAVDNGIWGPAGGSCTNPTAADTACTTQNLCADNNATTDNSVFLAYDATPSHAADQQQAACTNAKSLGADAGRSLSFTLEPYVDPNVSVTITGASGTGAAGTVSADAETNVSVTITGAVGTGAAGTVSASTGPQPAPVLVQSVSSNQNPVSVGISGNDFHLRLPNPVLAGNAIVLKIAYASSGTLAATPVSDDNGTWPTTPTASQTDANGNVRLAIFVLPNAAAGMHNLTVAFTGSLLPFQYDISEWKGIATSSPANGSVGNSNVATPTIACGSFTPGNNDANGGNLILYYAYDDDAPTASSVVTTVAAGGSFHLLDADIGWNGETNSYHASSYYHQETSASVNPSLSFTMGSGTEHFICLALALKVADAGQLPPFGIRIKKIHYFTHQAGLTGTWYTQFPTDAGNLIVVNQGDPDGITDNHSNSYSRATTPNVGPNLWLAQNATPAEDLKIAHDYGTTGSTGIAYVYEVVNAATSGQPGAMGETEQTNCDNLTSISSFPLVTPSAPNGLSIGLFTLGQGPGQSVTSPSGAVWDLPTYTGETDNDRMANADGAAHLYNGSTMSQQSWAWTFTQQTSNTCHGGVIFLNPLGGDTATIVAASGTGAAGSVSADTGGGGGPLTFVQACSAESTGTATSLQVTCSTTAGDLLVAWCREGTNSTDTITVTDSQSQSWTLSPTGRVSPSGVTGMRAAAFYKEASAAVSSVTCNFSTGGGVANRSIVVFEVSGVAASSSLDTSATSTDGGTVTSLTSGSFTTTNADDVLVYCVAPNGSSTSYTNGANFTIPTNGWQPRLACQYRIVSTTQSAQTTSMSWSTAHEVVSDFLAFKKAAGGGNASTTITSATGTGAPGAVSATGTASATVAGAAGTGAPGTVSASGSASATIVSRVGTGAAGAVSTSGGALATLVAAPGTGQPGTVSATGTASASLAAAAGTGAAGIVSTSTGGDASVSITAAAGTGAAGSFAGHGSASATLTGAANSGTVGVVAGSGGAAATLAAAPGTGAAGTVAGHGAADATIVSRVGTGAAGALSASGGASSSLASAAGTGAAGQVSTSTGGNVSVSVSSAVGAGAAGVLSAATGVARTIVAAAGQGIPGPVSAVAQTLATITGALGTGAAGAMQANVGEGASPTVTAALGVGAPGALSAATGAVATIIAAVGLGVPGAVSLGWTDADLARAPQVIVQILRPTVEVKIVVPTIDVQRPR